MNIGSVNARAGRTNLVAYSTAKAGLLGLTRFLARELGPYGILRQHGDARGYPGRGGECVPRPAPCAAGGPDQAPVRPAPRAGPRAPRPWWRSLRDLPPRSSRGSPFTSTAGRLLH
ncbi:SDR family NAD(P)-dependent oxidoreductase [Streptomyces sp. NPDC015661]|uniref:SDR family NAD(P)-dependent oxidoreductase n=1 Tax=Streptomyces sp. NPDC015661 TaxID=3364961 RepID=UPI0036F95E2A